MNKSIWNLYKNSERGKQAIELFSFDSEKDNFEQKAIALFNKYKGYLGGYEVEDNFIEKCYLILDNITLGNLYTDENDDSKSYLSKLIDNLEIYFVEESASGELVRIENERPLVEKKDYKSLCSILAEISVILYFDRDIPFIPILFREQFDILMKTFDVLDIPIPELPSRADKRGRLLFYGDLSDNILNFGKENNLKIEETCACIYDFANMLLDETEIDVETPEPTNIWITGASKEDYKAFLENPVKGTNSVWTCNENTKRGDIILMYVLSPYSCIQSIWRADIDGVFTPFNYFNSRAKVKDGITIPHITLSELKADSYFSLQSFIRKNFQGVNGIKFSAKDYHELQRMLNNKGFDISILPQLYNPNLIFTEDLKNEKAVEEKLLIPLLEKLNYSNKDWSRQLSQKAGRKEKAIPDFVFFPKGENHFQNAPMVIEAKFDMSSNIERTQSYNQALSYARLMKSHVFGICDKDRLIIYKEKNGYFDRFKPAFEKHWPSINNAEIFAELKQLIGKEVIK